MKNGLYSIRIEMLGGVQGQNTGVMVLRDGTIRSGDRVHRRLLAADPTDAA